MVGEGRPRGELVWRYESALDARTGTGIEPGDAAEPPSKCQSRRGRCAYAGAPVVPHTDPHEDLTHGVGLGITTGIGELVDNALSKAYLNDEVVTKFDVMLNVTNQGAPTVQLSVVGLDGNGADLSSATVYETASGDVQRRGRRRHDVEVHAQRDGGIATRPVRTVFHSAGVP